MATGLIRTRESGSMRVMAEPTDRELLERCRAGDDPAHAAFRALYERHAPEVLRLLVRLLGDRVAAEDGLQETFVRLHGALRRLDPARPVRPYALRIARNVAIEALRRSKGHAPLEGEGPTTHDDDALLRGEARDLVTDALQALTPDLRSAIVLRHGHGLTLDEVGAALGVTSRTVRNRLRAAAVLLARELEARGVLEPRASEERP